MASFYGDLEGEWRDDGIDRLPRIGEPTPDKEIARRPGALARLEMRRIFPLAIFLAGVLVGKVL